MPLPPGASVEDGKLEAPFPGAEVDERGAVTCTCCRHPDCELPFGEEFCLTITSDTDQFYEIESALDVFGDRHSRPIIVRVVPNSIGQTGLPDYSPQTLTGSGGTPLMLFLSSGKDLGGGVSVCYRFAMPIFFQCVGALDEEGHPVILGWRLCALKPSDVVTIYAGSYSRPIDITCFYSTMESFYGWTSPPICGTPGCYSAYSYDAIALYQSNSGVISFGEFFTGCDPQCSQHIYNFAFLPGRLPQRIVVGTPVLPATSMDLSVAIPGWWFNFPFCGTTVYFDDFNLFVQLSNDLTHCDPEENPNVGIYAHNGSCWVPANVSADWCPCTGTTTTSTTTTTTSSTTTTTTSSTSSTSSTSTSSTTTTTAGPEEPIGDDSCCPDFSLAEAWPTLTLVIDAPTCECMGGIATMAFDTGLQAWTAGYFPCSSSATVYLFCRDGSPVARFVGCGVDVEITDFDIDTPVCGPVGPRLRGSFDLPPGNSCCPLGARIELSFFPGGG